MILSFVIALVLSLSLSGCGGNRENQRTQDPTSTPSLPSTEQSTAFPSSTTAVPTTTQPICSLGQTIESGTCVCLPGLVSYDGYCAPINACSLNFELEKTTELMRSVYGRKFCAERTPYTFLVHFIDFCHGHLYYKKNLGFMGNVVNKSKLFKYSISGKYISIEIDDFEPNHLELVSTDHFTFSIQLNDKFQAWSDLTLSSKICK